MSKINNINSDKILSGSDNYFLWYDYITWYLRKEGLIEYIIKDKIKDTDTENTDNKVEINRFNYITNTQHNEIAALKLKYGGSNDYSYWTSKLNKLHTDKESEIMTILNQMKDIFFYMNKYQLNMSEDEKIKCIYDSLPRDYLRKYVLEKGETFESLYEKINNDISKMSYIENWRESYYRNDPMEIDYVKKNISKNVSRNRKNNNYNYNNKNKKYCDICKMNNHNKDEYKKGNNYCNSNYKRSNFVGNISKHNINDYYNANIGFNEIKTMYFDNNDKNKYVNENKNFNKDNIKKYKKKACNINLFNKFKLYRNNRYKKYKIYFSNCYKKSKIYPNNNYKKSIWLYDPGDGEHLTNNKSLLINYIEEKTILICANGSPCIFEGYVLYSEKVSRNIISGVEFAKLNTKAIIENNSKDNNNIFCKDCKISKMKRKSHNKETPKAKDKLEIIHSDIICPIDDSLTGMRFYT
ncbi:hypothetical protein PIROE2DRAFT_2252 [Piromyces sp. E2]|nr:hypothetical protein PIROE2DRAFT_2252 [Piromyces sp. E2]|eukprot:OUM69820.1 hypothetical protein PIROE2DRAFT_2252 [Piromyces sp. E2]